MKMTNKQQRHICKAVRRLIGKGIRLHKKWKFYPWAEFDRAVTEKTIRVFDKAIELAPNNAKAYKYRADILKYNYPRQALRDYTKAIELIPNYINAYMGRALIYRYHFFDNKDKAISEYTAILEFNPNYYKAYIERGNNYALIDRDDLAIKDYTKAIELKPNSYTAYLKRGQSYSQIDKYDYAIRDLLIALNSKDEEEKQLASMDLSEIYYLLKEYDKAIIYYTETINIINKNLSFPFINRDLVYCYRQKSEIYLLLGKKEEADMNLKLAIEEEENIEKRHEELNLWMDRQCKK